MIINPNRYQILNPTTTAKSTSTAIPSTTALVWAVGGGIFISVSSATNPAVSTASLCLPNNLPLEISLSNGDKIASLADTGTPHLVITY